MLRFSPSFFCPRLTAAAIACSIAAIPSPAHAEVPLDTVETVDGGLVRGSVAEKIPGDHVTIVLPDGRIRVVPWIVVSRVVLASEEPPPPPPKKVLFEGPTAIVHIDADKPVVMDRKPQGGETWIFACEAPCDVPMPIGDLYRIVGSGVMSTSNFKLTAQPGERHVVHVKTASKSRYEWGRNLAFVGFFFDFYGALLAGAGWANAARSCGPDSPNNVYLTQDGAYTACRQDQQRSKQVRNGGLITLGIGVGITAVGALLYLSNLESKVAQAEPAKPAQNDAYLRQAPPPRVAISSTPGDLSMPLVDWRF